MRALREHPRGLNLAMTKISLIAVLVFALFDRFSERDERGAGGRGLRAPDWCSTVVFSAAKYPNIRGHFRRSV